MLPLSLSVSLLLLLSSVSLQALALQARSLQGVQQQRRQLEDQLLEAAQQVAARLQRQHRSLLPLADSDWDPNDPLLELRQGMVADQPWRLVSYVPDAAQGRSELRIQLQGGGPSAAFALHWQQLPGVGAEPWLLRVQHLGLRGVQP